MSAAIQLAGCEINFLVSDTTISGAGIDEF